MTVCNWETNRTSPQLGFIPRIIAFLGYDPYDTLEGSLGQQILAYRAGRGLTQRDLAGTLAVDPGTVRGWEKGQHLPLQKKALRLGALVVGPAHSEANSSP